MLLLSIRDIKLFVVIVGHLKGRLMKLPFQKNHFEIPKVIQGFLKYSKTKALANPKRF
jgi:hypothetical protein